MTWQAWLTAGTLLAVLVLLARERYPASMVILGAAVFLMLTGVIDAGAAFSGFSNPAPITVAALYVLTRGIAKTGALQPIVQRMLGTTSSLRTGLARLLMPAAMSSAFLNNTPIVATLVPQVTEWAKRLQRSPSSYLLPLSYAAMFGGMVTLIGTSTNLLVSGLLEARGLAPLGMFEISRIGVPIAAGGILLVILLAPRLVPTRVPPSELLRATAREFVVNMLVDDDGPLDGHLVGSSGLRNLHGVFLVQVDRGSEVVAPVTPDTVLFGGDRLTFVGRADDVVDLHTMRGLRSEEKAHLDAFDAAHHTFFEAVIGPTSPLVGRTFKQIGFRARYHAAAVAVHRAGHQIRAKLGSVPLRVGDTLLLLTDSGFGARWRDQADFLLVSRFGGSPPAMTRRAWIPGTLALLVIVGAAAGVLPILHLSVTAAFLLVASGVLTPGEARNAVDLDVVVVIAGGFGLGAAVFASGLGGVVGGAIGAAAQTFGPVAGLLALLVPTAILTSVITNNAAAVLMFPLYLSAADQLSLDPRLAAMALAIMASAAFLTPMAYQTNLMVWGPGGYRFRDYTVLGAPLVAFVVLALLVMFVVSGWV